MINENLIIIKGGEYNDIKKALKQWVDLYSSDLQNGLTFQLYKNGHGNHIIQADKRLDNERFYYLINYLNYPEEIEYNIDIEGFTIGKEDNQLQGKILLVYISPTDKEYDNVYVTTSENKNFKIYFGGKITETSENRGLNYPIDFKLGNSETITVNRKEITQKEKKTSETRLNKRFKVLALITVSLVLIGIFINQFDPQAFRKFSLILGLGIGAWFFTDYKALQSDKLYIYCLGIAIGYLLFILKLNDEFNKSILNYGALYPLTLLLVQKPTRLIYKAILKREPVVDRPPPTFWDGIYMIILFFGFGILPYIIMDNLSK